jgi:hypothetical protein
MDTGDRGAQDVVVHGTSRFIRPGRSAALVVPRRASHLPTGAFAAARTAPYRSAVPFCLMVVFSDLHYASRINTEVPA